MKQGSKNKLKKKKGIKFSRIKKFKSQVWKFSKYNWNWFLICNTSKLYR